MPRQTNPIEPVLRYFRTVPLDAAILAVAIVKDLVRERQAGALVPTPPVMAVPKRRGPKPGTRRKKAALLEPTTLQPVEVAQG